MANIVLRSSTKILEEDSREEDRQKDQQIITVYVDEIDLERDKKFKSLEKEKENRLTNVGRTRGKNSGRNRKRKRKNDKSKRRRKKDRRIKKVKQIISNKF